MSSRTNPKYYDTAGKELDMTSEATESAKGLMSASDKKKLNAIEAQANKYSLPNASASTLGGVKLGSDTVQSVGAGNPSSASNRTYPIQKNSNGQAVVNVPWENTTYKGATTSSPGLMSASDKKKLDGILDFTRANKDKLTYQQIQEVVMAGKAKEVFQTGDIIYCNHTEYGGGTIGWRVVAFDKEKLVNGRTHSMTLLMDKAYLGKPAFDNGGGSYSYGCNAWAQSDIRIWLNSKKLAGNADENTFGWWSAQNPPKYVTKTSAKAPASLLLNRYGFLHGIDPGFESILAVVEKKWFVHSDNVSAASGVDLSVTHDKIFLPSYTNLGFGNNSTVAEGQVYDYFASAGTSSSPLRVIKDEAGSTVYWWMGSAYPYYGHYVWYVDTDGGWDYGHADYSGDYAVVPACVIG